MSKPDISKLIAQASFFLQNPQAFEKMLESLEIPDDQKAKLRGMFKQLTRGGFNPDPNYLNQLNATLDSLSQSGLPPEMGNISSIMEKIKDNLPKK